MVPYAPDSHGCSKDPDLKDKIHCVAFVIDGSTIDVISDKVQTQMKDLQVRMNHRGKTFILKIAGKKANCIQRFRINWAG